MNRAVLAAPVLAAAFPVLFLYSHNIDQDVGLSGLVVVLVLAVGAGLLTLALWLFFRDPYRASFLATAWVLLFFAYGPLREAVEGVHIGGMDLGRGRNLVPVLAAMAGLTAILAVSPWGHRVKAVMPAATVALAGLALYNLLSISLYYLGQRDATSVVALASPLADSVTAEAGDLPDIYYIVPDRYASNHVLREHYGFDNTEFLESLEQRGFYVAEDSNANYHKTFLSLASSLNMEYLDGDALREAAGGRSTNERPVYARIQDHAVWRILERHGYRFAHFGAWWGPTRYNHRADLNVNYFPRLFGLVKLDEFSQLVLQRTALSPIQDFFFADWNEQQRVRELHKLERLGEVPNMQGPKFVFVHLFIPHPPYVFDQDGLAVDPPNFYYDEPLTQEQISVLKARYIDQLIYTNRLLLEAIDHILENSERPPVILLQADEGPFTQESEMREPPEWGTDTLQTRLGILNAYHLPGVSHEALYPGISPVNSFRMVFNEYFGAGLPLLEDRAHVWRSSDDIYDFMDVTEAVRRP
jgi:hypothetical protein